MIDSHDIGLNFYVPSSDGEDDVKAETSGLAPTAEVDDLDVTDEDEEDDDENASVASSIAGDFYVCNLENHRQLEPFPESALHSPQFVNGTSGCFVEAIPNIADDVEESDLVYSYEHAVKLETFSSPDALGNLRKIESLDDLETIVRSSASSSPLLSSSSIAPENCKNVIFEETRSDFGNDRSQIAVDEASRKQLRSCVEREGEILVGSAEVIRKN